MSSKSGRNLLFLGKGGTGKTTIAALTALAIAEKGEKVALVSMDPAHNLFDIFQINSRKKVEKLKNHLIIEEIDVNSWIKIYLKSVEDKIAKSYKHLTTISLDKHIEILRYAPGLEEYAMQYAYEASLNLYSGYKFRIFDMPPTALALKFLNLPKLTLIWLEQLLDLRIKILEKKRIIEKVHNKDIKGIKDEVLNQLNHMKNVNQSLNKTFQTAQASGIYIVLNEDQLSLSESVNIYDMVTKNGFHIDSIVVNKFQNLSEVEELSNKFSNLPVQLFPLAQNELIGAKELALFMKNQTIQPYIESILKTADK
jgi:arsenite-transporting ATPase